LNLLFKLTYYYIKVYKELLRIENIETTSKVVAENFYYKNGKLIYVRSITDNEPLQQLHLIKGKMLNESNLDKGYKKTFYIKQKCFRMNSIKATNCIYLFNISSVSF
jgi:hypothetical protein